MKKGKRETQRDKIQHYIQHTTSKHFYEHSFLHLRCWKSSVQERRWGHRTKKKVRVGHKKRGVTEMKTVTVRRLGSFLIGRVSKGILLYHSSPLGQHWWSDEWRENVLRLRVKVCRLISRDVTKQLKDGVNTHTKSAQFKLSILF